MADTKKIKVAVAFRETSDSEKRAVAEKLLKLLDDDNCQNREGASDGNEKG